MTSFFHISSFVVTSRAGGFFLRFFFLPICQLVARLNDSSFFSETVVHLVQQHVSLNTIQQDSCHLNEVNTGKLAHCLPPAVESLSSTCIYVIPRNNNSLHFSTISMESIRYSEPSRMET